MEESGAAGEYERLREQLATRYALAQQTFHFGNTEFTLCKVAEPDVVLQEVAERSVAEGEELCDLQPYWAEVWQAAHALCHLCASVELEGKCVLDLGCGLGLTTAVIASRGADVVAVDVVPEALDFCRLNCWSWREQVVTALVDWRYDRLERTFTHIVAADILYDRDHWPFIESFWRNHLEPAGTIAVSEPGRHSADSFAEWLRKRGWYVREEVTISHGRGRSARQRLFEITRQEQAAFWCASDAGGCS